MGRTKSKKEGATDEDVIKTGITLQGAGAETVLYGSVHATGPPCGVWLVMRGCR